MKSFEIMYILIPSLADVDDIVNEFDEIINTNKGKVMKSEVWGEKRLAYDINDFKTGIYVVTTFKGDPCCAKELDRKMRINENVIRHLIISKSGGGV